MLRLLRRSAALLVAFALPSTLHAQLLGDSTPPQVYIGIQGAYGRPVGEFSDYVKQGAGLAVNVAWTPTPAGALALRADGGFLIYGSERNRVCFGGGVGCRVELDLTTTNSIAFFNLGPQLILPRGPVRPYIGAAVGFAYFATTSDVEGSNDDEPFAESTNFDDFTFAWGSGGGILIPLAAGRTPVLLDIGARYHGNGEAEYLKKGDIQDNPDGSISFTPTRSQANLVTFQLGVVIGARSSQR